MWSSIALQESADFSQSTDSRNNNVYIFYRCHMGISHFCQFLPCSHLTRSNKTSIADINTYVRFRSFLFSCSDALQPPITNHLQNNLNDGLLKQVHGDCPISCCRCSIFFRATWSRVISSPAYPSGLRALLVVPVAITCSYSRSALR